MDPEVRPGGRHHGEGVALTVSPERFRLVLGRLAAGVSVVTSRDEEGGRHGLTATSVCSVSLEPPLVLVVLEKDANTHAIVERSGLFAVNFLGREQREVAERFATTPDDKFEGLSPGEAPTGAPILEEALAWLDCVVVRSVPAGDHTVFIGRVEAADLGDPPSGLPLVRYAGRWADLCD